MYFVSASPVRRFVVILLGKGLARDRSKTVDSNLLTHEEFRLGEWESKCTDPPESSQRGIKIRVVLVGRVVRVRGPRVVETSNRHRQSRAVGPTHYKELLL